MASSAFETCTNMGANLYLPATLETIGSCAFKGDFNIQYIVLNGLTPPALGEDVFEGCDYLFDIDLNAHGTRQEMQRVAGVRGRAGASLPRLARAGPDCAIA